ncbi:glycosyltransferase family 2 protein [Flavobacterium petrolei]|uniref:Glycosyltransferase family 2 protein n=1 Tax=Flavobacterium petrolei TaxID=2259594 RepID=A0A482THD6_9FLAO|nr:glycosyltransferase family 2 protein [Flavobacterium petrolei]RYJ50878.1 glycosyltransferase family 2 protein [Flavobacterium petrolei]
MNLKLSNNLVSIIIPIYNRADLIGETLNSIITQTYMNWECVVIDDGSTDDTAALIADYIKKDSRFQYHQRPVDKIKGANSCRNYGFELSKGEYIKWFDSDDIMHPDFLEKQVKVLIENPNLDFCASFSEIFDYKSDKRWPSNPSNPENKNTLYNYIAGKLFFLTPSPLWRRVFLNKKVLFDENLLNAHEADFNFKRLIEGVDFEYIKEVLFYVRRGHHSIDLMSISDPLSFKSMFDYYQKVYLYLCEFSIYLSDEQRLKLRKQIIYRQNSIFYSLRFLQKMGNCNFIFFTLIDNIKKSEFSLLRRVMLLFGICFVYLFKKGYNFILINEFKNC